MQLLGATAIEDKLQDGVAVAIQSLMKAGIKVRVAVWLALPHLFACARRCGC